MAFSSNIHTLPGIRSYANAHRHFVDTTKPRSANWQEHMRPLKDTRSLHYRIEQGSSWEPGDPTKTFKYYALYLYSTPMVTYYEPEADGSHRVKVQYHCSNTSTKFLHQMGQWYSGRTFYTSEDPMRQVCVPLANPRNAQEVSADLVFDERNRLIIARSKHVPIGTYHLSDADKRRRAEARQEYEVLLDMAMTRADEFVERANAKSHGYYLGRPFSSVINSSNAVPFGLSKRLAVDTWGEDDFERFFRMAGDVVDHMNARWVHEQGCDDPFVFDPVKYRTALMGQMLKHARLTHKSGITYLPQFPEQMPREFFSIKQGDIL